MSKSGPKAPRGDYEVGYCRPPEGTQFKKGQSGNPKGRPRKVENLATVLHQILGERVRVREGEVTRTISKQEAMLQSAVTKAIKGDTRTLNTVLSLAEKSRLLGSAITQMHPVLVVPGTMDPDEWAAMARAQQAKYAGNIGEDES